MWQGILHDVRMAVRGLRRNPAFTLTAVATLAVGIGVNVAVFTVANAVLFKGFPLVEDNGRILYVDSRERGQGCCVSYPDFRDWRAQAKSFEGMATVADLRITLDDGAGVPESYTATLVSAGAFRLLRQGPMLGRDFDASDERPGAPAVAILSHAFWERRFGADPLAVGRTVRINGAPATVIGVMPQGFSFPQSQDLWMPLTVTPEIDRREARGLWFAFGRLVEGATIDSAQAEMEAVGLRLAEAYPRTNAGVQPTVHRFQEFFIGPHADALYGTMLGAVALVLLIACANLANLLLARAIGRSREMSVRIALGGSRARIVRQVLTESLALSLMGGALGWWVAKLGVRLYVLSAGAPPWFENVLDYSMDARVFAYLAAISAAAGMLFGLLPAIRLSRLDVQGALKEGGRSATGGGRGKRLSGALVMGETALAVMLLAGAGVMIRSFLNIYNADAGVQPEHIVTALLRLPDDKYPDAAARVSFLERLEMRLEAVPGVETVAMADTLPTWGARSFGYELEGAESTDEQRRPRVAALLVNPDYFRTLGAGMLAGRGFEAADGVSGPSVALVNQRFAGLHWPGEDPVGKRFRLFEGGAPGEWRTIVGVAPNIVQDDATRQRFDPVVYLPFRPEPARAMWVMAKATSPAGLGTVFEREVHALDAELPIWLGPFSLTERLASNYRSARVSGGLFLAFAAIALFLAAVGLYAVIAYAVNQQTREIGVRLAIGASRGDILGMVFGLGMRPVAAGLVAGLAGSVGVNRVLEAQLVQVSPFDPTTLVAATAALLLAAALGCWIPARRAVRVDPVIALRQD